MENVGTQLGNSSTPGQDLVPGFEGETMTLADAIKMSQKSKVTVLKLIKKHQVPIVGKVTRNQRGRPANLYDRDMLLAAIHSV